MKLKIVLSVDGDEIYNEVKDVSFSWVRHRKPCIFRNINIVDIDKLSRILEEVGKRIVRHDEPDVDEATYLSFFHPMTNEGLLRGLDIDSIRDKYNEEKNSNGPGEPKG